MRSDKGYSKDAYFKKMSEEVSLFYQRTDRWPRYNSEDKAEKILGDWCHKIRVKYSRGQLPKEKILLLQQIQFSFQPSLEQWMEKLDALKKFLYKGTLPPLDNALRNFAYEQYRQFDELPDWKKNLLVEANLLPVCNQEIETEKNVWNRNFKLTVDYYQIHGKLPTRKTHLGLEGWVSKQRQLLKKGLLTQEREQLFSAAGILLLARSFKKIIVPWDQEFGELREFVEKQGCFPTHESNKRLYFWLHNQNKKYRDKKLTEEQVQKLESVGFVWKASQKNSNPT